MQRVLKNSMRLVFVVMNSEPGDVGGPQIRNYNLVKQLSKLPVSRIHVFCLKDTKDSRHRRGFLDDSIRMTVMKKRNPSLQLSARAIAVNRVLPFMEEYRASGLGEALFKACLRDKPQAVHIEQIDGYYSLLPYIERIKSLGIKIVLDTHNVEYLALKTALPSMNIVKGSAGSLLLKPLRSLELQAVKASDLVLACSSGDADYFSEHVASAGVHVLPNGVDLSSFPLHSHSGKTVLFMGGSLYPPNQQAILDYIDHIHPALSRLVPGLKVWLINTDPVWLSSSRDVAKDIVPLGYVDDIQPYLKKATIGICPITSGSGTRIKILTYMASGLPVVSTLKGAEGIKYQDQKDILIAETFELFAQKCASLINSRSDAQRISKAGRQLIEKEYDWNVIGHTLRELYETKILL